MKLRVHAVRRTVRCDGRKHSVLNDCRRHSVDRPLIVGFGPLSQVFCVYSRRFAVTRDHGFTEYLSPRYPLASGNVSIFFFF
jgi:hypothetical protein